ncbi:MAG: hypothetical protein R2733_08405 [Acidimicrobiales bacterium]
MMQPPPARPPFATPTVPPVPPRVVAPSMSALAHPLPASPTSGRDLPTMADLDQLQSQLDALDLTLADLDQSGS